MKLQPADNMLTVLFGYKYIKEIIEYVLGISSISFNADALLKELKISIELKVAVPDHPTFI